MVVSAEARWFWRQALPPELDSWFRAAPPAPGGGRPRTDRYLADAESIELGIKQRGGVEDGVEIKGRIGSGSTLPPPFVGRSQLWSKWSSQALSIGHLPGVDVHKTRWLRKYDTSGTRPTEIEVGADERPKGPERLVRGCQFELVSLQVDAGRTRWWTIGFEAFGDRNTVEDDLLRTIALAAATAPPSIATGHELSYPAWLVEIAAADR